MSTLPSFFQSLETRVKLLFFNVNQASNKTPRVVLKMYILSLKTFQNTD